MLVHIDLIRLSMKLQANFIEIHLPQRGRQPAAAPFSKSLPLWGRWHGEAVTDEVASYQHPDKSEFVETKGCQENRPR